MRIVIIKGEHCFACGPWIEKIERQFGSKIPVEVIEGSTPEGMALRKRIGFKMYPSTILLDQHDKILFVCYGAGRRNFDLLAAEIV